MRNITEEYKDNKTKDQCLQLQCIECQRETRHKVVQSYDYSGSEVFNGDLHSLDWESHYQIIQCQGCMTISFRQVDWCSEWEEDPVEILFPKRTKHTIRSKDFWHVPSNLRRIYHETIECFNNNAYTLCAAGLRALVEGLCAELNVNDGPKEIIKSDGNIEIKRLTNLEGKIAGLHERGFLTKAHSDVLHEHRYLGNEAVHQLAKPSSDELTLAIEIIEHIFNSVYEIPRKALDLKSKRTKRRKET